MSVLTITSECSFGANAPFMKALPYRLQAGNSNHALILGSRDRRLVYP